MTDRDKLAVVSILAVDDEPQNNELIERAFHSRPEFRVRIATSPELALALVRQQRYDVLLVDYKMPQMNGVEFIKEARNTLNAGTTTIMITAYPDLEEVIRAQTRGLVTRILAKPWSIEDLLSAVDRALGA